MTHGAASWCGVLVRRLGAASWHPGGPGVPLFACRPGLILALTKGGARGAPLKGRRRVMTATTAQALSRRRILKGALAAGIAAPAILRIRAAYAAYPDRPVK